MDSGLKQRLIGAAVLVALAVIFLPMLVQGPAPDSGVSDLPLNMPEAPKGDYETQDLPLVVPGAAPNGGAVGLETGADEVATTSAGASTSATAPPSSSQAIPLGDSGISAPSALPTDPAVATPAVAKPAEAKPAVAKAEPMLPATSAGGNYVVHFGSYAGVPGADAVVKLAKAAQLPAYREATILNGKPAQRVRIGPYATRAEAESARIRAAQVRGDVGARVVALDAEAAKPPPPAPAAATTSQTASAQPNASAPSPSPSAQIAPVAAPAAANVGFAVQLGAFGNAVDATALRDKLRAAGFSAFTEQVNTDKGRLTRVRVGPVISRSAADQLQAQVKAKIGIDGIVRPHP